MNLHKDKYLQKLHEKAEQAEIIYDITTDHHSLIEQDAVAELDRSLNARQRHIDNIHAIEQSMAELQPETAGWAKDGEIKALYQHINSLIRKTMDMDEENLELGQKKKGEYRAELRKTRESRKGVGAYMSYTAEASGFDQKR